jgi:hypothetical protein
VGDLGGAVPGQHVRDPSDRILSDTLEDVPQVPDTEVQCVCLLPRLNSRERNVSFREEFRAPEAYESLRGTNPRAGSGQYGDLGFGPGWKDQPRADDWRPTEVKHALWDAAATGDHHESIVKTLVVRAFPRTRVTVRR